MTDRAGGVYATLGVLCAAMALTRGRDSWVAWWLAVAAVYWTFACVRELYRIMRSR
jgi:hypothetical protein